MTFAHRRLLSTPRRRLAAVGLPVLAACVCTAPAQERPVVPDAIPHATSSVSSFANTDGYQVRENVGN